MQHDTLAQLQGNDHAELFDGDESFDGADAYEAHHYDRPVRRSRGGHFRADSLAWDEGGCYEPDPDFEADLPWSPACAACGTTEGAMGTYQGEPLCHACHLDDLAHASVARDTLALDE